MPGPILRTDGDLRALLSVGALASLPDATLLDLFERRRGEPTAEHAFATLVARHGGLVLRVARTRLAAEADARDAFQATFWLLARRSRSIRHRDALAGWLWGVASRVAARAAADAARRRARERRAVRPIEDSTTDPAQRDPDLAPALAAAIARLPAKYRVAVILCDLEGLSSAEAAARLGCPVGTLKARLSRARSRLRTHLAARGFAPADWHPAESRPTLVPFPLIQAACRVALSSTPSAVPPAAALASIVSLAQGASRTMVFTSISTWAAVASVALAASVGGALINQVGAGRVPASMALSAGPGLAATPSQPAPIPQARPDLPAPQAPPPVRHPAIRQAMAAVEAMAARNEKDRDEKVSALIQLGRAQTDQGERDAARETLREALGIVVVQPPGRQTWSLVSIGSAQVRNGDRVEGQRTFDRLPEVFRSLHEGDLINPYWNAIRIEQRSVGRDASQALIAAYHDYVLKDTEIDKYRWGPVERARSIALAGRFAEAWERVRQSPDLERPNQPFLRPEAAVAVANALLPDDPPDLIAATLAEARRFVLEQPELERPQSLWKFNNLTRLMDIASLLGRFDEAEELGSHFPPAGRDHLEGTETFNKAACYDLLAEEENAAGQVDRAIKSARQALAWVRDADNPDTRSYPMTRAITALVAAGGDEEAFQVYEATSPGLLWTQYNWDIIVALRKQGKMALARRWTEVELARNRQLLRQVQEPQPKPQPLADPHEEARRQRLTPSEAILNRWIAQAEALLGEPARAIQVIEGQPTDVRPLILKDLAIDLAQRGQVAEALEMAGRAASPQARRAIEIAVATNLPVPARPPAAQSPLSDAAR